MQIVDVAEFIRYYGRVRGRTRAVVDRVPEDRWEWTPNPGRFSPGDLVRHLAATERWMFGENVQGLPSRYPGHGPEVARGHAGPVAYMDHLHPESLAIFAELDAEALERLCPTPGGIRLPTWKWLRAMIEHEIHHRGQLYEMLGAIGVPTPPLYGLTEPEVLSRSQPGDLPHA